MNFDDYQKAAKEYAIYPKESRFSYVALGLASECGEVAGKLKKIIRDQGGIVLEHNKEDLVAEAGDVLWYLAALASELNITLEEIAELNINKLASRKNRGVISGSGDNR